MWHVSIASSSLSEAALRSQAKSELHGVGDARLGEWHESYTSRGLRLYHIRRRLRPEEEALVGPVVDIRGTPEYDRRRAALTWLPPTYQELPPALC